jgi:hypothetical protein
MRDYERDEPLGPIESRPIVVAPLPPAPAGPRPRTREEWRALGERMARQKAARRRYARQGMPLFYIGCGTLLLGPPALLAVRCWSVC